MVKCDDTTSGIVAGLNAGCWTVGIAKTVGTWANILLENREEKGIFAENG